MYSDYVSALLSRIQNLVTTIKFTFCARVIQLAQSEAAKAWRLCEEGEESTHGGDGADGNGAGSVGLRWWAAGGGGSARWAGAGSHGLGGGGRCGARSSGGGAAGSRGRGGARLGGGSGGRSAARHGRGSGTGSTANGDLVGGVVGLGALLDLERVVGRVADVLGDGEAEGSASGSGGQGGDGLEVLGVTLAENEGDWDIVGRRVLDRVGLAGNDAGWVVVDGEAKGGSDEGRGGEDGLSETHIGGGLLIKVLITSDKDAKVD